MTGVLMKRGNLDTNLHSKRTSYGDEGRDLGQAREAMRPPEGW